MERAKWAGKERDEWRCCSEVEDEGLEEVRTVTVSALQEVCVVQSARLNQVVLDKLDVSRVVVRVSNPCDCERGGIPASLGMGGYMVVPRGGGYIVRGSIIRPS